MAKRIQVVLNDAEYREIQQNATLQNVSITEWIQQALRSAFRKEFHSRISPKQKLEAVRSAAKHSFPTSEIEDMLAQIEQGYLRPN
jgi:iron-sulfur cluster repair protein YtfE (RIC family)